MGIRVVVISDTHGYHDLLDVPDGDLLLFAGDCSSMGYPEEIIAFNEWLGKFPHNDKIVIAGNHDFLFESNKEKAVKLLFNAIYLEDSSIIIQGIRIFGSPWVVPCGLWAFQVPRGPAAVEIWKKIPESLDILMTHAPPWGIGDWTVFGDNGGYMELLDVVKERKPRFHIFGHIHEGYSIAERNGTTFINASSLRVNFDGINKPIVFDI